LNKTLTLSLRAALACAIILSNIQASDSAVYYNLVVTVKPLTNPITEGDYLVIIGTVTDQASKPVANVNIFIMFGKEAVTTTTDQHGNFRYNSATPSTPGMYQINVVATKSGFVKGITGSMYTVEPRQQQTQTATRTITGLPIQAGNYTVYLGKVTQWNLETTCFVKFSDKYLRFLKTCDLYNLAPEDFKTDDKVIPIVSVIQYNDNYRLFPQSVYIKAYGLQNDTLKSFVTTNWIGYTAPK
jgi:hypothetical protein